MPAARLAGPIVIGVAARTVVRENAFDVLLPNASVTFAVNENEPVAVGVPVIEPVEDRLRPPGSAPLVIVQVCVPNVPDAESVCEYAVPVLPCGNVAEVLIVTTDWPTETMY